MHGIDFAFPVDQCGAHHAEERKADTMDYVIETLYAAVPCGGAVIQADCLHTDVKIVYLGSVNLNARKERKTPDVVVPFA